MLKFKFDKEKAISAILHITKELLGDVSKIKPDLHKVFKILYFADQEHLVLYGRPIVGDYYVAMEHGPVPSNIYDMVKFVRGDSFFCDIEGLDKYFEVKGSYIYPKQSPDMDAFSESDVECINKSILQNKDLSFDTLKAKSHDGAYRRATKDDKISCRAMAKIAGADEEMIAYLRTTSENERIFKT